MRPEPATWICVNENLRSHERHSIFDSKDSESKQSLPSAPSNFRQRSRCHVARCHVGGLYPRLHRLQRKLWTGNGLLLQPKGLTHSDSWSKSSETNDSPRDWESTFQKSWQSLHVKICSNLFASWRCWCGLGTSPQGKFHFHRSNLIAYRHNGCFKIKLNEANPTPIRCWASFRPQLSLKAMHVRYVNKIF